MTERAEPLTDDGPVDVVLAELLTCVRSWEPKARLLGNVRAADIDRAITALQRENDRLREALETIRDFPPKGYKRRTKDGYPAELIYDEYAYKRIINTYREVARAALTEPTQSGEGKP